MPLPTDPTRLAQATDAIHALDTLNGGIHPGHRPVHAKGLLLSGTFTPTPDAATLSRAPHFLAPSTPVLARFSDFAGIPTIPDNDPNGAGPRGCAIRFQLAPHVHTDIVAHSADGFPVRTIQEFTDFVHAITSTTPDLPHPTPIEQFLGSHPAALAFVQLPKPIPTSFARESYFGVNAFKFIDPAGLTRHIRYRILPDAGNDYLTPDAAAAKGPNFLMEELAQRLASTPIKLNLHAQIANDTDTVDDATIHWPPDRKQILLGVITLTSFVPPTDPESPRIIFDPIPRVDGIAPSADPLLESRADTYIVSGRRRREAAKP
jgi:catalase